MEAAKAKFAAKQERVAEIQREKRETARRKFGDLIWPVLPKPKVPPLELRRTGEHVVQGAGTSGNWAKDLSKGYKLRAAAMEEHLAALERYKDHASQLFEATRTPIERFEKQIGDLDRLLSVNAITWDLYGRGVRDARKNLEAASKGGRMRPAEFRIVKSATLDVQGLHRRSAGMDPMLKKADEQLKEMVKVNKNLQRLQAGGGLK